MSSYKHIFSLSLCIAFVIIWIIGVIEIPQAFSTFSKEAIGQMLFLHGIVLLAFYSIALLGLYWTKDD